MHKNISRFWLVICNSKIGMNITCNMLTETKQNETNRKQIWQKVKWSNIELYYANFRRISSLLQNCSYFHSIYVSICILKYSVVSYYPLVSLSVLFFLM